MSERSDSARQDRDSASSGPHSSAADLAAERRALLDAALDGLIVIDEDGYVTEFSRSAEEIFGFSLAEAAGRKIADLIVPERYRAEHEAGLERVRATGDGPILGKRIEMPALCKDGREITIELTVTPLRTMRRIQYLAFVRDVTEERRIARDLATLAAETHQILEAAGEGIVRLDPDGRATYINAAAEAMLGWSREDLVGRNAHELIHHAPESGDLDAAVRCPILDSARGGGVHRAESERFWRKDGTAFVVDYISAPFRAEGGIAGAVVTFRDVTLREEFERQIRESRDRFEFLSRVSEVLVEAPLEPMERLRKLAKEFVPGVADWCAIDLVTDRRLQRIAVEHVDPKKVEAAQQLFDEYPPDPAAARGAYAVLRSGDAELYEEIDDEFLKGVAQDGRHLELMRALQMKAAVVVPMVVGDRILGVLTIVSAESGRVFGRAEARLFADVAARAAVFVENARLYTEKAAVATTLQKSLLPPIPPEIPGLAVAARYVAASEGVDVGGDFYDIFQTNPSDWTVVLGDVSGKGADAAAMTALARYTIRAAAITARRPSSVLATLNRAVLQHDADHFCTVCYARVRLTPTGARLTVSCGGHPRPLVLRASGRVEEVACRGSALGMFSEIELEERSARLKPGDTLVMFTDGVTEARGRRGFLGERVLRAFLRGNAGKPAADIASGVEHLALEWQAGRPRDDIAIVVLQVPAVER